MKNNVSNYQEYTFPKLLGQYDKVLVPMIQRDYAQGRKDDKKAIDVRNNLLNDIFTKESVNFDLVFGSKESRIIDGKEISCFIPIDGQQRLTTLFLLYLYAKKVKGLWSDLDLSKFSYDTRRAASDFCKDVTTKEWSVQEGEKVSKVIKDTTWFMDYWENDPTVEGMLNMLDAIHEKAKEKKVFPCLDKVKFYFFDLESHGLNENLYLKMNSRGKPLTAFENLKAKIEKVLPNNIQISEKCFPKNDAAPKDSFKKWKFFMDRNWTESFWDEENPSKYDVNIAKFIVRFLSGYWAAFGQETDEKINGKTIAGNLEDINKKEKDDKNYTVYIPFEPIEKVLKLDNAFPSLAYAFTTAPTIKNYWSNDSIKVSDKAEYKLLSVIFTYTLFDGDESAMRFAWNMAENYVSEYDNFVTYCKRVGEIYKYMHANNVATFYKSLSNTKFIGNISDQLKEEITKANRIVNEGGDREFQIIEAEKYAFFKGAIRFLFTKEEVGDDWGNFGTKWKNAQKYFDENGVKDKTPYKDDALLMKSLLANCDNFLGKIWWHFEFSNDKVRWKRILTSDNWKIAVDAIMSKEVTSETTTNYVNNTKDDYIKNIIDDGLMDYVCNENEMSGAWLRSTYHGYQAIWVSGYPANQIVLNPILSELQFDGKISYYRNTEERDNSIPNCRYYKCIDKNVYFKYKFNDKYYYFNWWGNPNEKELDVYLTEENWNDYKRRAKPTTDKNSDEDTHYCFRVTQEMEQDTSLFINELKRLIKEAEEDDKQCEKTE
jgi:hypothetical protein